MTQTSARRRQAGGGAGHSTPGLALSRVLDAAENTSPVDAVEAVTRELAKATDATAASFLIVDFSGRALVRLAHIETPDDGDADQVAGERRDDEESATILPFDGGPPERALRTQTVQIVPPQISTDAASPAPYWRVLAPVTERGDVMGLLELHLPTEPDAETLAQIARTAHVLGFVVIATRRHTDLFEWGQRSKPFTLPAEIQRRLLPDAFTCEAGVFTLSAWLEPAATIGGDTYDYSLGRDTLHMSVTDAMGHGLASALTATLCVGSLRNTRREGADLNQQAAAANAALLEHGVDIVADGFVTGLLGRLDMRTGALNLINAGHPAPLLARDGAVTAIDLPVDLPFGMFPDAEYRSTEVLLKPGDRLIVVTDGMLERNTSAHDLAAHINQTRSLHPRETTRYLADQIINGAGPQLADDATLLILDWHGQQQADGADDRSTVAGADITPTAATNHRR